jgi:hypothetical protein
VNKDTAARRVTVDFKSAGAISRFNGSVDVVAFGREQYQWTGRGPTDLPNPDRGLVHSSAAGDDTTYVVAPESLTVIRGAIKPATQNEGK